MSVFIIIIFKTKKDRLFDRNFGEVIVDWNQKYEDSSITLRVNDWKGNVRLERVIKVSELLTQIDPDEDCSFMDKTVFIQHIERYIEMAKNGESIIFLGLFI